MLEQEIVGALGNPDVRSSDLLALIERTESAIVEAEQAAESARSNALDPALSPDPKTAREAMVAAEFDRDRLRTLLPRLQERLQQVAAAEAHARWLAQYERASAMVEKSARDFARYPELVNELIDLFRDAEAVDKQVSEVNGSAPSGEPRRLRQVELVARGLKSFSRSHPPISKAVQLAGWTCSDQLIWPPPQMPFAVAYAQSMVWQRDPLHTADWAAAQKEDNVRRAETENRWAEEEAARQAESRRAYEASLRR